MLTHPLNEIGMNSNLLYNNCCTSFKLNPLNTAFGINTAFSVNKTFKSFDDYSKNSVFSGVKTQDVQKVNTNVVFPTPIPAMNKPVPQKEVKKTRNSLLMSRFQELKARNSETIHRVRELEESLNDNFDKLLNIYDKVEKNKKIKKEKRKST